MIGSSVADAGVESSAMPIDVRAIARARADVLGLPNATSEDWRYVRCDTFAVPTYAPQRTATTDELRSFVDHTQRALVIVDGKFHSLGHGDWPAVWRPSFPTAIDDAALATSLATETNLAACWAVADGTCRQIIHVSGSHTEPLHVVNVTTGGASGFNLDIDVAAGAHLEVIVRHIALGVSRSCPAISLRLGRGAEVYVSEIQSTAWHHLLPTATLNVGGDAQIHWTSVIDGGACVRLGVRATLAASGAHVALAGLAAVHETHQAHHWLRVVHAAGNTTSDQLFKNVLHDQARTSFDGCVQILAGADGANAVQQNRNLLLSDSARADTRPQLDIKADDVKAAHGATVGQLDADELLYLRMRGLPVAEARALLTHGFSGEVLARLKHRELVS